MDVWGLAKFWVDCGRPPGPTDEAWDGLVIVRGGCALRRACLPGAFACLVEFGIAPGSSLFVSPARSVNVFRFGSGTVDRQRRVERNLIPNISTNMMI